jgi:ubiquinone/menaquinone biosynthesis C-methylase UbiE
MRFGKKYFGWRERTKAQSTNTQYAIQLSGYQWAADYCGNMEGRRILDVACGEGFGAGLLAEKGADVYAADLNVKTLASARFRFPERTIAFLAMDGTSLAFASGTFDIVFSQDTIEHIHNDRGFLSEIHRVLKSDGYLFLITPRSPVFTEHPANPYHVREYDEKTLGELLLCHFKDIRWFGRRRTPALDEMETAMNRVRWIDPLGMRRFMVPTLFRHYLGSLLCRREGLPALTQLDSRYVQYYPGTEGSLALIACCRKKTEC